VTDARGLAVHDLVVRYGAGAAATVAVDHVTLDVAPGDVVALLGPSGCGKSSLLRAVAGLEPAAGGTVTWDGADLAGVPVHRRGFGLMFQDGQLFPHRDVGANVEFGMRMARAPRAERDARVHELLDVVGLTGYERRAVTTLSGGEQQRVALARALAPRPRVLLLDEPLSALDRALRERLAADLRTALTATGTTALLVTHDHDEAFAVADRVAVMDAGRLLQVDTPAQVWRRPASRRVAEFLGYEAFVALDDPTAGPVRAALAARGADEEHLVAALAEGALVVVPETAASTLHGTVRAVAFRRGRAELDVDVPAVGRVTVLAPAGSTTSPGVTLALAVDPEGVALLSG
jgi:thiamine transport system ATP-binding protein